MADKPEFFGKRQTPKREWEQAIVFVPLDDAKKLYKYAELNNGIAIKLCKSDKSGKEYCVIDTFRKQIPQEYGGEQTSNNNQQQQTSTYVPKYKSNNDYKNDAPPSMPVDNGDDNLSEIPF